MKTLTELKEYFDCELVKEVEVLEKMRKRLILKARLLVITIAVIVVTAVILVFLLLENKSWSVGWSILFIGVGGVFGWVKYQEITTDDEYHQSFKSKVINALIHYMYPALKYHSTKHIPMSHFMQSKLFPVQPTKYKGDDYVHGNMASGVEVHFSELHAQKKQKSSQEGDGLKTVFKGLFFDAITSMHFKGSYIVPKDWKFEAAKLGFNEGEFKEVPVKHEGFNQYFKFLTRDTLALTDKVTTDLIDSLVQFRKEHNDEIYVSFFNTNIYVAIWHEHDLFEPKLFHTLYDFSVIQEYYDVLYPALMIVEKITSGTISKKAPTAV